MTTHRSPKEHQPLKETVLITGASSGIGLELTKLFAADGSQLILVARREENLKELSEKLFAEHGTQSIVIPMDLSLSDSPRQLFHKVNELGLKVDLLVNNAGFGQYGQFIEIPLQRHLDMLQVNVSALVELTHLFLGGMLERKTGSILNIGSTASFQPGPNSSVYYATKAFVLSFSEALWVEAKRSNVHVCCLCPGPTKTEFGEDSKMGSTLLFKYNCMSVEAVAKAGHRGIRKRKRFVMPGIINNLLSWSVRIAPRRFLLRIMDWLQPPTSGK